MWKSFLHPNLESFSSSLFNPLVNPFLQLHSGHIIHSRVYPVNDLLCFPRKVWFVVLSSNYGLLCDITFVKHWLLHSLPSISPARWSSSGPRLTTRAALPLMRPSESRWKRYRDASPSSWPVCRAKAVANILTCLIATQCMPPSASQARGMKARPCCRHASAAP